MKFEIPFNETIFKEQMTLNFNTIWKENLKKSKKLLIWAIPILLFGGFLTYQKDNLGLLFIAVGIHYLINFFNYYFSYKKNKKSFFELVENEKNGQIIANGIVLWEFNDDYLKYKDYRFNTKIKWEAFKNVRIINKNLFLDLNIGERASYILGETEVGIENFNKITEFVKGKIKHQKMRFDLEPHVGAGEIKLGMTKNEIRTILGKPEYSTEKSVIEYGDFSIPVPAKDGYFKMKSK